MLLTLFGDISFNKCEKINAYLIIYFWTLVSVVLLHKHWKVFLVYNKYSVLEVFLLWAR